MFNLIDNPNSFKQFYLTFIVSKLSPSILIIEFCLFIPLSLILPMQNQFFTFLFFISLSTLNLFAQTNAFAQNDASQTESFTYVSDRRYNVIHELDGEVFVPSMYQIGQGDINGLNPGQIVLNILPAKIMINGVESLGEFQILSKHPDRVGYIYELMDIKGQSARLKVVLNQEKFVDLLYFYSKSAGEHTFYLAQKKEAELASEKTYFTGKNQYFVRAYSNLIDKTFFPYSMIDDATVSDQPTKIKQSDNLSFVFGENTVTTPKGTFDIKDANTYAYNLQGFPSVKSMIEINLKGKSGKVLVFLNFKQQIELIEVANSRYFLMP